MQHKIRESLVRELQKREEERKKEKGCHQQPCCLMQLLPYVAMSDGSWVDVILLYVLYSFSISNNIHLSRGCRQFAEPRYILYISVLPLLWTIISTSPVVGISNTRRGWGFCLFNRFAIIIYIHHHYCTRILTKFPPREYNHLRMLRLSFWYTIFTRHN